MTQPTDCSLSPESHIGCALHSAKKQLAWEQIKTVFIALSILPHLNVVDYMYALPIPYSGLFSWV